MLFFWDTPITLWDLSLPFKCCMLLETIGLFFIIYPSSVSIFSNTIRAEPPILFCLIFAAACYEGLGAICVYIDGVGLLFFLNRSLSNDLFIDRIWLFVVQLCNLLFFGRRCSSSRIDRWNSDGGGKFLIEFLFFIFVETSTFSSTSKATTGVLS